MSAAKPPYVLDVIANALEQTSVSDDALAVLRALAEYGEVENFLQGNADGTFTMIRRLVVPLVGKDSSDA